MQFMLRMNLLSIALFAALPSSFLPVFFFLLLGGEEGGGAGGGGRGRGREGSGGKS